MDDNEKNQFIRETVLGKCWHMVSSFSNGFGVCDSCGGDIGDEYRNPNYTTDLNAVREAELKTVEKFGYYRYVVELKVLSSAIVISTEEAVLAAAKTRCLAIINLWERT